MPRVGAASAIRRTVSTPARWPAMRGRPRRVAQRPLPSMIMATCKSRFGSAFQERELCIVKSPDKNFWSGRCQLLQPRLGGLFLHRVCSIAHDLLQHGEIVEITYTPLLGDVAHRLRAVV